MSTNAVSGGGASPLLDRLAGLAGDAAAAAGGSAGAATRTQASRTAAPGSAAGPGAAKANASKSAGAKGTTAKKKTTTKKATGYATGTVPKDFAFLRDPKLTLEEKLSRFIGMMMTRSEQDLLRQMEKMAPGSAAASGGATGANPPKPAAKKTSLWGLAKALLPPLGMAAQLVGDSNLKKLVQQLSGPVLGAAATALGGPALGALASQVGPTIGGLITRDVKVDLSGLASLVGLGGGAGASASAGGATAGAAAGAAAGGAAGKAGGTTGGEGATSEKAQLMELQRLQDRDREMFSLFSNMLRAMHESRMTAIQNIR